MRKWCIYSPPPCKAPSVICDEPKCIYEYCFFRKTRIFTPTIIEPLKNITLLFRECFQKVIVMPSHIFHQLLHFGGIVTTILLGTYIAVP